MCNREACGDKNNRRPWCGSCQCHIDEVSLPVHMERVHPDPRIGDMYPR